VQQNGMALQFAHLDLRKDKEVVKLAVQKDAEVLKYADESLRDNCAFLCDLFFSQESLPYEARKVLKMNVTYEVDTFLNKHHTIEVNSNEKNVLKLQEGQIQLLQSESVDLNMNISDAKTLIQRLQEENAQLKKLITDQPLKGFLTKNEEEAQRISKDYKFDLFKFSQSFSE